MQLLDGTGQCDNCGQIEENGGVIYFAILSDIDDSGASVVKLFCRRNKCNKKITLKDSPPIPQVVLDVEQASQDDQPDDVPETQSEENDSDGTTAG